jgi:hypothetical protein
MECGRPSGAGRSGQGAAKLGKDSDVEIYCGCCPMEKCPNIRPACSALKQMGFTKVRMLHVPISASSNSFLWTWPVSKQLSPENIFLADVFPG